MGAMLMVGWMTAGSLFGGATVQAVSAAKAPPARPAVVTVELKVQDPELAQMARDLEREVLPLLPPGGLVVR